MVKLTITRGAQASGKTTWTLEQVAQTGAVRLNRDDKRRSMFGRDGILERRDEDLITESQRADAVAALAAGRDVIVDDMNLRMKYATDWADLAVRVGADFHVEDFTFVPLNWLIDRDRQRAERGERSVGEAVIRETYDKFIRPYASKGRFLPPVVARTAKAGDAPPRVYVPDLSLPPAWLVDVDGTLALKKTGDGSRGYYDWLRVDEDDPNPAVVSLVKALYTGDSDPDWNMSVVLVSGRMEEARPGTGVFLKREGIPYDALFMRADGDMRPDNVVKAEIFWRDIAHRWNVVGVVDDRDSVVAMWRAMGLTCLQVAPRAF